MKKMIILALGMMFSVAGFSQALATKAAVNAVTPDRSKKSDAKGVKDQDKSIGDRKGDKAGLDAKPDAGNGERKLKGDGTPDKRYKENKHLKKDGTPDKRYKEHKGKQ